MHVSSSFTFLMRTVVEQAEEFIWLSHKNMKPYTHHKAYLLVATETILTNYSNEALLHSFSNICDTDVAKIHGTE
jgi:hypothetical protein